MSGDGGMPLVTWALQWCCYLSLPTRMSTRVFHVILYIGNLLLFHCMKCSIVWVYHSLFSHFPGEHYGDFQISIIVKKAYMNIIICILYWTNVFFLWGIYLGVVLLGHRVDKCLALIKLPALCESCHCSLK